MAWEQPDRKGHKDPQVRREHKVQQAHKAWREMMAPQVPLVHKAQLEQMVHRALRESPDQRVHKDCKVSKE
jgi:hypothetical protein